MFHVIIVILAVTVILIGKLSEKDEKTCVPLSNYSDRSVDNNNDIQNFGVEREHTGQNSQL